MQFKTIRPFQVFFQVSLRHASRDAMLMESLVACTGTLCHSMRAKNSLTMPVNKEYSLVLPQVQREGQRLLAGVEASLVRLKDLNYRRTFAGRCTRARHVLALAGSDIGESSIGFHKALRGTGSPEADVERSAGCCPSRVLDLTDHN